MKKQEIVDQSLATAEAILTALTNKTTPDLGSLDKWSEALLRYVLYYHDVRTSAQYLENAVRQMYKDLTIPVVQGYIDELNHVISHFDLHLNQCIEWEPIFDSSFRRFI